MKEITIKTSRWMVINQKPVEDSAEASQQLSATPNVTGDGTETVSELAVKKFVVLSLIAGGRAKRIACGQWGNSEAYQKMSDQLKLVPSCSIAAELSTDGGEITPVTGRAFCALPLPIFTGLPVHVR